MMSLNKKGKTNKNKSLIFHQLNIKYIIHYITSE